MVILTNNPSIGNILFKLCGQSLTSFEQKKFPDNTQQ